MRWNLKEAVNKSLVRRTEIAYKAKLREISWPEATKSNNYHICSSRVNAAAIHVTSEETESYLASSALPTTITP